MLMTRLSTIVLILALTGLPVHGQDQVTQVKRFRGDKEVDSKGTQAETPQGETADPVGVPEVKGDARSFVALVTAAPVAGRR